MKNIWILHPQGFYPQIVSTLAEYGVQVTYLCGSPEKLQKFSGLPSECITHSSWDAIAGKAPPIIGNSIGAADPDILDRLAASESMVLQMFERLNYTGLAIHDLRRNYLRFVALWSCLLQKRRPDAVVFHIVPHSGFDYVLYLLCRLWGIRTLIFERTYLPDRLILIEQIEQMPKPSPEGFPTRYASEHAIQTNYYDARNRMFEDKRKRRFTKLDLVRDAISRFVLLILQIGRRPLLMYKPYYCSMFAFAPRMPTWLEYLWRETIDTIYLCRLRDFYEGNTTRPDLMAKYIYYPLQFQPERTSIPMGLAFADQLLALNVLVESLPPDWYVYVKEHPRQFTDNPVRGRLGRSKRFYETLIRMKPDRIRLVGISTPSDALVRNSKCVATVAGTAGWEAVRTGVPAIVFGAPWYTNCPGVFQVSSIAQCKAVFEQICSGEAVDLDQVQAFTEWIRNEASFPGYIGDVFERASSLSADENAHSYAQAIASRLVGEEAFSIQRIKERQNLVER